MKKIVVFFALLLMAKLATSQVVPDFTANDCSGNSHNLYTDLNAGKVVVLVWVMPCGSCVGPALTAYNVAQSFSNPNVVYYLMDDAANTSCTSLSSWANSAGIGANRVNFSTSAITESNYGGVGMPHVAVVGTSNHTYFFNALNTAVGNATAIQNAITTALATVGIETNAKAEFQLNAYPSPANQELKLNFFLRSLTEVKLELLSEKGELIKTIELGKQNPGEHQYSFELGQFASGNYFVRLAANNQYQVRRFTIAH